MGVVLLPPPRPQLRVGRRIGLLGIPQRRLQALVPQTPPDRRQAHSPVDQLGRVRMTHLVERATDPGLGAVPRPALLHSLIPKWATPAVLLSLEQRPFGEGV